MNSYKDLIVWQKAMDMVVEVYSLMNQMPKNEQYALTDQMRRAAVSVPSNIAEGYGRNKNGEFIRFLNISKGSLYELETQLDICVRIGYLQKNKVDEVLKSTAMVNRMIYSLIRSIKV